MNLNRLGRCSGGSELYQEIEEFWAHFHSPVTFEDSKQLGEVVMVDLDPFDWILHGRKMQFRREVG